MQVTYKCKVCNTKTLVHTNQKPNFTIICSCGGEAKREFKGISTDKEDDTISYAIETMKYATNPSGKQKTII